MAAWTQCSRIYEISTWVWLYELSRRDRRHIGGCRQRDNTPTASCAGVSGTRSRVSYTFAPISVKVPKRWPNN